MKNSFRIFLFTLALTSWIAAGESIPVTVRIANRALATHVSSDHVIVIPRPKAGAEPRLPEAVKRMAVLDHRVGTTLQVRLVAQAGRTLDDQVRELAQAEAVGEVRLMAWDDPRDVGQIGLAYQISARIIAKLAPQADPARVLTTHGCDPTSIRALMPGVFVATARSGSPLDAMRIAEALGADPAVVWSELDLLRARPEFTPNDPQLGWQWHLNNDGTVTGPATTGNDIRAPAAWDLSSGLGINIGIVDDGIEWLHDDLIDNFRLDLSKDFIEGDTDPTPAYDPTKPSENSHGTFVAGLAAARGNNGIGMCGVAPLADLVGLRIFPGATTSVVGSALVWHKSESTTSDQVHISNNSYGAPGDSKTMKPEVETIIEAYDNGVGAGRNSKGIIYVVSAGNDHTVYGPPPTYTVIGPDNVCYDGGRNIRHIMTVGALRADGTRAPYSETGCALAISAPGGDASTYGLASVDRTGVYGINPVGDYTEVANADILRRAQGTSFAAPVVSGVAALMLSARPQLSWRDVQMILMRTARKNDPGNTNWWTTGSGLNWNYEYGFGCVNAAAAVAAAQSWTLLPDEETIPDATAPGGPWDIDDLTTLSIPITVTPPAGLTSFRIETVEFTIALTHPYPGDLSIELESPSGLRSMVPRRSNDDNGWEYPTWTFLTRAHLSELAVGTWTVRITDHAAGFTGQVQSVALSIHGYRPYATPSIVSVTPTVITQGSGDTQVTIAVTNPAQSAQTHDMLTTVEVGGTIYPATLSGSELRITLPSATLATAGTRSVVVANPTIHGLGGGSASASLVVNNPPVATANTLSVTEDTTATGTLAGTDANGDALTYSVVSQGGKGTVTITNATTGAFSYTPSANATGADSFTFRATDVHGTQSSPATITVTIAAVNDPPALADLSRSVTTLGTITGTLTAVDVDGPALTYSLVSQANPAAGTFHLVPATGAFTYTSTGSAAATDAIVISVSDGSLNDVATMSITIVVPPPSGGGSDSDGGGGGGGCSAGGATALIIGLLAGMLFIRRRRPGM